MLVLVRNWGESITIGDDILVTVLSGRGRQIRLGITAPKNIAVHREEIHQRIADEEGRGNSNA